MTTTDTFAETELLNTLAAHRVLGDLITAMPTDTVIARWELGYGRIDGLLRSTDDGTSRTQIRSLADLFGLAYAEAPHTPGKNMVSASGAVSDVPVHLWKLVVPVAECACGCHREEATA